jgi:hypothetical protein
MNEAGACPCATRPGFLRAKRGLLLDEGVFDHFVGGVANAFVQHGRLS